MIADINRNCATTVTGNLTHPLRLTQCPSDEPASGIHQPLDLAAIRLGIRQTPNFDQPGRFAGLRTERPFRRSIFLMLSDEGVGQIRPMNKAGAACSAVARAPPDARNNHGDGRRPGQQSQTRTDLDVMPE